MYVDSETPPTKKTYCLNSLRCGVKTNSYEHMAYLEVNVLRPLRLVVLVV
jgi:hypothetical protein